MSSVLDLVNQFFVQLEGEACVDEAIVNYVAETLSDQDAEHAVVEDLEDLLCSTCPSFASQTPEERLPQLLELFQQVC